MKKNFNIGYLTKEGFKNIHSNRLMSFASIAVLTACLIMIGSAFLLIVNIENVMHEVESENVIMVYLDMDSDKQTVSTVKDEIDKIPNVNKCVYYDKETAYTEALSDLGSTANYFDGVENPLPEMFEVSVSDMTKFSTTVNDLSSIEHVDVVRNNKEIAEALVKLRTLLSYVSIAVIFILLIISLFIIGNTIKITMFNRRLEINIMKSVGATRWFIRWPFIVEGMLLGIISAVVSFGLVWLVYYLISPYVSSLFSYFNNTFKVVDFRDTVLYISVSFVVIGVVSGAFGSLISVQKYLKEKGAVIYDEVE